MSFIHHIRIGESKMPFSKTIEISSESPEGFDNAVRQGLLEAAATLENIRAILIKRQEAVTKNDRIAAYRVHMEVTYGMQ